MKKFEFKINKNIAIKIVERKKMQFTCDEFDVKLKMFKRNYILLSDSLFYVILHSLKYCVDHLIKRDSLFAENNNSYDIYKRTLEWVRDPNYKMLYEDNDNPIYSYGKYMSEIGASHLLLYRNYIVLLIKKDEKFTLEIAYTNTDEGQEKYKLILKKNIDKEIVQEWYKTYLALEEYATQRHDKFPY